MKILIIFIFVHFKRNRDLSHYYGFSACPKCTGRFKTWVDPENPSQNELLHEAWILFRIGHRQYDLQKFTRIIKECDQLRNMPKCCLLNDVLLNYKDYGTSSILLDDAQVAAQLDTEETWIEIERKPGRSRYRRKEEEKMMQAVTVAYNDSINKSATKARKSNRSRKSSKKKHLKNLF